MELIQTIATIVLILLNGFFVVAEFAIVKVRTTQIETPEKPTSAKSIAKAKKVTTHLDNYLAATQLGVTIASLGLGWIGEEVTTEFVRKIFELLHISIGELWMSRLSIGLGFGLITTLHIVFGELIPKSIAIRKPVDATFFVSRPLSAFYWVMRPFIWVLNQLTNFFLKMIGIGAVKEQDTHSEEEIKLIISESSDSGVLEDSERELINNVFDFDSQRVREVLVHRKDISAIDIDTPFSETIHNIISDGYSRYPVYKGNLNEILGILYIKDLIPLLHSNHEVDMTQIVRPAFYIPDSMKIKDVLKSFQKNHNQMAIVTDEYGDIAGIVTMEDILEELVGDIQDEHDAELPIVEKQADGSYIIQAHESIDDINEYLPIQLPLDEHYTSLSGLITFKLDRVPAEGDVIELDGYQIIIQKLYRSSVERVMMRPLTDENMDEGSDSESDN